MEKEELKYWRESELGLVCKIRLFFKKSYYVFLCLGVLSSLLYKKLKVSQHSSS